MKALTVALITSLLMTGPAMAMQTEVDSQEVAAKREAARLKALEAKNLESRILNLDSAQAVTYVADVVVEETTHVAGNIAAIIYDIFGVYGDKAVSVASCESGLDPNAVNGQYFGLFQMGEWERASYGGSSTDPTEQTQAAYAYFLASGSDWSPWSMGACA